MLIQVDSLPDPKGHFPLPDRNAERCGRQRGADVSRHVIRTFGSMLKDSISVRNKAGQEPLQIGLHGWIGIFLNQQRTTRMLHKQMQHLFASATLKPAV